MPEIRKHERNFKSQLGQFFTPFHLSEKIIYDLPLTINSKVLEPGCGDGGFVRPLIHRFDELYHKNNYIDSRERFEKVFRRNIWGVEIDKDVFEKLQKDISNWYCVNRWKSKGTLNFNKPNWFHHICHEDFLTKNFQYLQFDFIIGNPPFGGTIDYKHQDYLESNYGVRKGWKIKKESYSFFIVKSIDLLKPGGEIRFICSDTFLTISTMSGLRKFIMSEGEVEIERLDHFSLETNYPMVIFKFKKTGPSDKILLDGEKILKEHMKLTGNFSWTITPKISRYFSGPLISDYMVCTGGMTTGKNEYFVRPIDNNEIEETYNFDFFDDPITLEKELARARLNKLSESQHKKTKLLESSGATKRNIKITAKDFPEKIKLPHPDYKYYNKSTKGTFYESPKFVIYWKDNGDAVYTFKRNGNWYLHGVGGKPFFEREGVTWSLISSSIKMRYLPEGYILDSGAPCGFLKNDVDKDELFFILGWCNTKKATDILKKFINHTKNIQGKDLERLPYPSWVGSLDKKKAIKIVKNLIEQARNGNKINNCELNKLYEDKND